MTCPRVLSRPTWCEARRRCRPVWAAALAAGLALGLGGCGAGGVAGAGEDPAFVGFRGAAQVLANPRGLPDSQYGACAAVLDWNADGRPDLAIAGVGLQVGGLAEAGAVHLYLQHGDGVLRLAFELTAASWPGGVPRAGARLGAYLAVGDLDGDGYQDLALGAPGEAVNGVPGAGRVYVLLNSPLHGPRFPDPLRDPRGPEAGAGYGAVLAVGDLTGDGVHDLAVAAPGARVEGRPGAGRLHVHPGRADLLLGTTSEGPLVSTEPEAGAAFGSITLALDVDGDGVAELLVAAPGATLPFGPGGKLEVWSVRGGGLYERRSVLTDPQAGLGGQLGSSMAAADLDRDGDPDLLVAVPGGDVGGVVGAGYVAVFENIDPATCRFALHSRYGDVVPEAGAQFGTGVAVGDFDGDGQPDVVAGSPAARSGGLPEAGQVSVLLDAPGVALTPPTALLRLAAPAPSDRGAFGSWIEAADFDGDGFHDLAVMAPGPTDAASPRPGAAFLLFAWVR